MRFVSVPAIRAIGIVAPVLLSAAGLACAAGTTGEPQPTQFAAPRAVVERLQAVLLQTMQEVGELGYQERYDRLAPVVRESFDVAAMARAVLAGQWSDLSPDQRRRWIDAFERFHVSSMADVRERYRGQEFRLLGEEKDSRGDVLVHSQLDYPKRVVDLYTDYRLRSGAQGWRIVDVHSPPSVSEVAMRRAEYGSVLESQGFEKLISTMEARIVRRELE